MTESLAHCENGGGQGPKEPTRYFARSTDDHNGWQLLRDHLTGVANLASNLGREACPGHSQLSFVAELAGLLHDLGKYREQFQEYLKRGRRHQRSKETAHAVYGAAAGGIEFDCAAVAFAVVGHHAGLHDQTHLVRLVTGEMFSADRRFSPLLQRADSSDELAGRLVGMKTRRSQVPPARGGPLLFEPDPADPASQRRFEFAARVLFSLLVDADRLDSERFEQKHRLKRAWTRAVSTLDPVQLLQRLEEARRDRAASHRNDDLNRLRNGVFESCLRMGRDSPQGFFTLTVPTGGAKTLSSMAFALSHANTHKLRRVIVVIPYLSIIEQNAREYRTILGANQVLEHHSAVDVGVKQTEPRDDDLDPSECADVERVMENWDVPIVVTTSVQFIETLFAASPARTRKLHNIAQSVVVFDEVQTLPTHLLEPTLDTIRTLKDQFGVTVLFSSATQPAFRRTPNLQHGFSEDELIEVAPQVGELYARLQRVKYRIESVDDRWDWNRLSQEMTFRPQALSVVNLRQHAFDAWTAVKKRLVETGREDDARHAVFHLSSAMCPAHRLEVLGLSQTPLKNNIKQRLLNGQTCWVVSTQLIEAGVDIDFPVVFRAMGPLDSIVQAAGRCNREGQLRDEFGRPVYGEVVVFHPQEDGLPNGIYRQATSITPSYLTDTARLATDPGLFAEYFTELYGIATTDRGRRGEHTIQESRAAWNFRTVAERAKVIPDDTVAIIVPYRRAAQLIDRIRRTRRVDTRILRRLQRYTVSLRRGPNSLLEQLHDAGRLQPLTSDLNLLVLDAECYDRNRGIVFRERSPEDLIV